MTNASAKRPKTRKKPVSPSVPTDPTGMPVPDDRQAGADMIAPAPTGSAGDRPPLRQRVTRAARFAVIAVLLLALLPPALITLYAFVRPPVSTLMLIERLGGVPINRQWLRLDEMSPHIGPAVIAAEDNLFCRHWGVDLGALREQLDAWRVGAPTRGASTLTMQTVKNLVLWPDRSTLRKAIEIPLAVYADLLWSKQRTLTLYLNTAEFGVGIYGVGAAAQHHFAKPAHALTRHEAALLAGTLPNPRARNPGQPNAAMTTRARRIETRVAQLGPLTACAVPTVSRPATADVPLPRPAPR